MKNGGPAFPLPLGTANCAEPEQSGGMTLRDYFAAKAMQGYCAREDSIDSYADDIAADAYAIADAMLAERELSIP
jgi:hypothetical protein